MSHISITENRIWCPYCRDYEKFLKIQNAARLADVNRRTIYRYLEEGKIYALKTVGGKYRVCSGCLIQPELNNPANFFSQINFRRSKLRGIEFGIFIFLISVASYGELNL